MSIVDARHVENRSEVDKSDDFSFINQLPDSLLLKIFSKLDFDNLITISKICKRWQRIALDPSLVRVIIFKKSFENVHQFVKNHFTPYLEEFTLQIEHCSYMEIKTTFDKELCSEMCEKSKNMKKLELNHSGLDEISIQDFPASLQHLSLKQCYLIFGTFFHIETSRPVPQLKCLELRDNIFYSPSSYQPLTLFPLNAFKSLKVLNLGESDIKDTSVESLKEILPQLEVLDVECCEITNLSVHFILNNCANIRKLFIGNNEIYDIALDPDLRGKVPHLYFLCLRATYVTLYQLHVFFCMCPEKSHVEIDFFVKCLDCEKMLKEYEGRWIYLCDHTNNLNVIN